MPDRHWSDGCTLPVAAEHAAQITFQGYFRLYKKLAGMSGTAAQNPRELRRQYALSDQSRTLGNAVRQVNA